MQVSAKKQLREYFLNLRQKQSMHVQEQAGVQVLEQLLTLEAVLQAQSIMTYLPTRGEINTWPVVHYFWPTKVQVLAPRCREQEPGIMDIHWIQSMDDLGPGHFGLLEPKIERTQALALPEPDIILIPALAFDSHGFRLGFGGGYYDRFLATLTHKHLRIGLVYEFQVVDQLPRDVWDQPVDLLVTPEKIIHCS